MASNTRLREMAASFCGNDIPGVADVHVCAAAPASNAAASYWKTWAQGSRRNYHTDFETALGQMTSGRNDVLLLTPELHTQADSITWDKNMTHLVGMYPSHVLNHRSRITHSVTVDPLIDITGYGCIFKNIYTMYGLANATDLTCLKITGNRNAFKHCHFLLQAAEPADVATFKMIHMVETSGGDGLEHYFDHVTISAEVSLMTDGEFLKTAGTPRLVFEDCLFIMRSDAADPRFIDGTAGDGQGFVIFKRCTFLNLGTSLTYGIGSTGLAAATDYVLIGDTAFAGCDDVIAAADEAKVWVPARVGVTEDAYQGLCIAIDQTG